MTKSSPPNFKQDWLSVVERVEKCLSFSLPDDDGVITRLFVDKNSE